MLYVMQLVVYHDMVEIGQMNIGLVLVLVWKRLSGRGLGLREGGGLLSRSWVWEQGRGIVIADDEMEDMRGSRGGRSLVEA